MNSAIKIAILLTSGIAGINIIRWFHAPLGAVTGCYLQDNVDPHDRICIYADGTYEQFSISSGSDFESYNNGSWISYSSTLNGETTTGITLFDYFDLFEYRNEVDIFPFRKMTGRVSFIAGPSDNPRYYSKEL